MDKRSFSVWNTRLSIERTVVRFLIPPFRSLGNFVLCLCLSEETAGVYAKESCFPERRVRGADQAVCT